MKCHACWGYFECMFDNCPITKILYCDDCSRYMGLINKGNRHNNSHDSN